MMQQLSSTRYHLIIFTYDWGKWYRILIMGMRCHTFRYKTLMLRYARVAAIYLLVAVKTEVGSDAIANADE